MDDKAAVRGGRVDVGEGKKKTLWQMIKAGLVKMDSPSSKHTVFTHPKPKKNARKRRAQIAQASRRAQRPPKRRTGVTPVRHKRVRV